MVTALTIEGKGGEAEMPLFKTYAGTRTKKELQY